MPKNWKKYSLPKNTEFGKIRTDYRNILDIFEIMNDKTLDEQTKAYCSMVIFYIDFDKISSENYEKAWNIFLMFINNSVEKEESIIEDNENPDDDNNPKEKILMDWNKDLKFIIPPINKILKKEIRSLDYLHWWTFLSAFSEIGECHFSHIINIRNKKNSGKKLEKFEKEFYYANKKDIDMEKQPQKIELSDIDKIVLKRQREMSLKVR